MSCYLVVIIYQNTTHSLKFFHNGECSMSTNGSSLSFESFLSCHLRGRLEIKGTWDPLARGQASIINLINDSILHSLMILLCFIVLNIKPSKPSQFPLRCWQITSYCKCFHIHSTTRGQQPNLTWLFYSICLMLYYMQYGTTCKVFKVLPDVDHVQGPPGQKGDQGATEIVDYNGNIQEALQVRQVINSTCTFQLCQRDLFVYLQEYVAQ